MSSSVDFEKCSIAFINVLQITVEDEVSGRYREPEIVRGLIVLNFIICRNELVPFLKFVQFLLRPFRVVRKSDHPTKINQTNDNKGDTDVLVEFVLLFLLEVFLIVEFFIRYRGGGKLVSEIFEFVVELTICVE